ncbi:MAG: ABC transporter permease, partial [Acidimicrobiales bacterium]
VELYVVGNPLAAVIDGIRRTMLLGLPPDWGLLGLAAAACAAYLLGGYVLFRRLETNLADVA